MCGPMVRCGLCKNNSCNAGIGRLVEGVATPPGEVPLGEWPECPGCRDSWRKRENGTPPANIRRRARIARMAYYKKMRRSRVSF